MSIRRILEALVSNDYRVTWQRWGVAAHIALKGDQLFTAEELYTSLKQHYPDIGLTTVYRTLDLLVELGLIDRIHGEDGAARYSLRNPDVQSLQELVCQSCGRTVQLEVEQLRPLLKSAAQRRSYVMTHYELRIYGFCPDCTPGAAQQ